MCLESRKMNTFMISSHLPFYHLQDSNAYGSSVNQFLPILNDQIEILTDSQHKKKVKIAILGAGLGGCATAYFLEEIFNALNDKEIKIDVYEKESQLDFNSNVFEYNGSKYDINPIKIDESQIYMNYFVKESGCKLSNDIDDNILTALFDSNGIIVQKYGHFNKIDNLKILLFKFGIKNSIKFLRYFIDFFKYRSKVYLLQDKGYTFNSVEKLIRKINPYIFTLSQQTFSDRIKKTETKFIDDLTNLACMEDINQSNRVPGLVGTNCLTSFFNSMFIKDDRKKILKYLLDNCLRTRLLLNRHVKTVAYDTSNSKQKTCITFTKDYKNFKKSYDYVIVAFPLTKHIYKQNFQLDILYRDFLDCELVRVNFYIINGIVSMLSPKMDDRLFKLYTLDPNLKFNSLRTCAPVDTGKILYCVSSTKDLNEQVFDTIFEKGWKFVKKISNYVAPLYKKVRYSHTPFPQVIIDDVNRSRVFYLNSLQWLACSKESNCISARNIAFLIAKKEFKKSGFDKKLELVQKYSNIDRSWSKYFKNFMCLTLFTSFSSYLIYKNLIKKSF